MMQSRRGWAFMTLLLAFLLASVTSLEASPGAEYTVRDGGVALRAQPDATAETVLTLTPGHLLVEFARHGDWVRVGVYREVGAFGWVPADRLVAAPRPVPVALTPEPEPPAPEIPPLVLAITGTPAVEFKGQCSLLGVPGHERTVRVAGRIPETYRFEATAAECRIRKHDFFGRMLLRLSRDGQVLAGRRTSGPFNLIEIRSAGPWGGARAVLRGGLVVRDRSKQPPEN